MTVKIERQEDVAIITLDRPEALNALSFEIIRDLRSAFEEVESSDARALLITGAGDRAFCAGADIGELRDRSLAHKLEGSLAGQSTFAMLDELSVPSIALVNGYAFGGGAELAMACTFRLATDNAKFGLPEVKLGLIPGYGGTQRLPRLVGEARAMELILTGRTVDAEEAFAIGLVNRIVGSPAMDAALAFAGEFTRFGLLTTRFARRATQRAMSAPLQQGLGTEAELSTLAYQTSDAEEGMAAFLEKRPPRFKDS
jgi:enoyl-CoA hydratase